MPFFKAQGELDIISLGDWGGVDTGMQIPADIPEDAKEDTRDESGRLIVGHSETGHHHVIERQDVRMFTSPSDDLTSYLDVPGMAKLEHVRGFDTHAPIELPPGRYMVKRGRQFGPHGWERAID
jgi:hypothetical protein